MDFGSGLSESDYADLANRWIDRVWAIAAKLRRFTHLEGKELVGGGKGDYAGTGIPYIVPGEEHPVTWRLRRSNPEIDIATRKPQRKYISASQDRNHLYFPPLLTPAHLQDTSLPLIFTEGEFKALALRRLASLEVDTPRFVPIGLSGVWNFRGTVGIEINEHGTRVPVKGVIPDFARLALRERKVILMYDADSVRNGKVRAARHALNVYLRTCGAHVGILEWPLEEGKGPDDWLATVGPYVVLDAIGRVEYNMRTDWEAELRCTATGKPKPLIENVRLALENVPQFAGLALDEFSDRIIRPKACPWPANSDPQYWSDSDTIELVAWLHRQGIEVGKESAYDGVTLVASRNRFHPVRDYLNSLQWDGEPRVDTWLTKYLGVKGDNYTCAAGRCWLISAVARIMKPGCKADVALLLIGPEGRRKSTVCRILAEPWFSDDIPEDLGHKDAQMHVAGHWILELPELSAFNKTEMTTVKAWMSREEDIFRPPYGRVLRHVKRQCVFIATSNEGEPLKATTGNRRFWPVEVGIIDTDALIADRDQLWAEAVELFNAGAPWWFTDESLNEAARREQIRRIDAHVWYEPIYKYCNTLEAVTIGQVLAGAINKSPSQQTHADKISVVKVLQMMGWKQALKRIGGIPSRVYLNPEYLTGDKTDDEE